MPSFLSFRDLTAFTTTHVMRGGRPVTRATHDVPDKHGENWQFYSNDEATAGQILIVRIGEVLELDPGLAELADLPSGWIALREDRAAPWQRRVLYQNSPRIVVDWSRISGKDDFYDAVLPQCGLSGWCSRNLFALKSRWLRESDDPDGPPYAFAFLSPEQAPPELARFQKAVMKIAKKSIYRNGGRFIPPEEWQNLRGPS